MQYPDEFQREVKLEHYRSSVQVTREVGVLALKTLITLNSGAFVVLLTFVGNTAAQSKFTVPLPNLKCAMILFLVGIGFSFLVIAYTYVATQAATPYDAQKKRTDGWFVPISVLFTSLGFVSFLFGVLMVVLGVHEVSK